MSLLMEALKKAEEARRQAEGQDAPAAAGVEAAPIGLVSEPIADPLSGLAHRFDAAGARFSAASASPPGSSAFHENAAREVFAARRPSEPRRRLWPVIGAGLVVLSGVAGYFWWQLETLEPPAAASAFATASAPRPAAVPDVPPAPLPPPETIAPLRAAPEAASPRPPLAKPAAPARAPMADSPRQEPADTAVALRLARAVPRTNPALEHAYEALQSGNDDEARRAYERVLRADGKNADALLGLATLAARQGQADAAHAYYLRALEADPSDATARAGVLSTGRLGDEAAAESQLKTALAKEPGSPPLNFALGSLYTRQQRWSEAQQAYFKAYTGDPGNPDLIFNLAVSLDHLREGRLAAQYYRMALDASAARTASFAREEVGARLRELAKTAE